jgi:hypothetical protein
MDTNTKNKKIRKFENQKFMIFNILKYMEVWE